MIVRANSVQERRVLAIRPAPLSVGMFAWLFLFPVFGRRFFRSFDGRSATGRFRGRAQEPQMSSLTTVMPAPPISSCSSFALRTSGTVRR